MLMEVYALAAVCDSAQETINIVRYHQVYITDMVNIYCLRRNCGMCHFVETARLKIYSLSRAHLTMLRRLLWPAHFISSQT